MTRTQMLARREYEILKAFRALQKMKQTNTLSKYDGGSDRLSAQDRQILTECMSLIRWAGVRGITMAVMDGAINRWKKKQLPVAKVFLINKTTLSLKYPIAQSDGKGNVKYFWVGLNNAN